MNRSNHRIFMGRCFLIGCLCLLLMATLLAKEPASKKEAKAKVSSLETWLESRSEQDVLFFKEDRYPPVTVKVENVTRTHVTAVRNQQRRDFPIDSLKAIELYRDAKYESHLANATLEYLKASCEFRQPIFHLLDHEEQWHILYYLEKSILELPLQQARLEVIKWSKLLPDTETELKRFYKELLNYRTKQSVLHANDTEAERAIREANFFIEEAKAVPASWMLRYLKTLAENEVTKRESLEREHPKWIEDDEIRPERQRHYHRSIDMNLYAFLFEANRDEAAYHGLLRAGELAHHDKDFESAKHYWNQLIQLVPSTLMKSEAEKRLRLLPKEEPKAQTESSESKIPEEPALTDPPALLRFNLFEE